MKKSQIYSLLGVLWMILAEVGVRDTFTPLPYIAGTVGVTFLVFAWAESVND